MAIVSLVLGLLGVGFLGVLAGLPAIVLGHIALGRARKESTHQVGQRLAIAGFTTGYASLLTTALWLSVLSRSSPQNTTALCANRLRNVGIAFRVWASDHEGSFPFHVALHAESASGTFEPGDAVLVFQTLSNELAVTSMVVCPLDRWKRPAASFTRLAIHNVSYEVEFGPRVKDGDPQTVLARCPRHGLELLCDGSVRESTRPR